MRSSFLAARSRTLMCPDSISLVCVLASLDSGCFDDAEESMTVLFNIVY